MSDNVRGPMPVEDWLAGKFWLLSDDRLSIYRDADDHGRLSFRTDGLGEVFHVSDDMDLHALAAFALQDQPFGFSRLDITALDTILRYVLSDPRVMPPDVWAAIEQQDSTRDRIMALLPEAEL